MRLVCTISCFQQAKYHLLAQICFTTLTLLLLEIEITREWLPGKSRGRKYGNLREVVRDLLQTPCQLQNVCFSPVCCVRLFFEMSSMQHLMLESESRQRQALDNLRLSLLKELDSRSRVVEAVPGSCHEPNRRSSRQALDLIHPSRSSLNPYPMHDLQQLNQLKPPILEFCRCTA